MKRIISMMLSAIMMFSVFGASAVFAAPVTDASDAKAEIFKEYIEKNDELNFDDNYFFLEELSDADYSGNYVWEFSSNNEGSVTIALGYVKDSVASMFNGFQKDGDSVKVNPATVTVSSSSSVEVVALQDNWTNIENGYIGVVLQNSGSMTTDTTVKLTAKKVTVTDDEGNYEKGDVIAEISYEFKAPINLGNGLETLSKVLTSVKLGNGIYKDDVVNALIEVSNTTSKDTINAALNDENMTALCKLIDEEYPDITVNSVDGIELPYAALSDTLSDDTIVYSPIVNKIEAYNIDGLDASLVKKAYDITLGKGTSTETISEHTPIVKQKVVIPIPAGVDTSNANSIAVYHESEKIDNIVVDSANKTVSFFVDSFSNFMVVGAPANDTSDDYKAKDVEYKIEQDDENPNKFTISIVPKDLAPNQPAQIVRFANAPMKFVFKNNHSTIADGEGMESFSYKLTEADGIKIELKGDVEKNEESSVIGGFSFVAMAEDTENLYTAGVGEAIKIADVEITGNGKFYVFCDTIEATERKIYTETVEDNQVELAKVSFTDSAVFDIPEKKLALTFKVDFGRNVIVSEDADYIGMTIAIKGINSDKEYTAKVGTISDEDAAAGVVGLTLTSADTATALGSIELPANDRYEFEVSGVGYRTFRGNVLLDTPKTVNLWTYAETAYNANGEEVPFDKAVIEGEDTIMKDVTFLVGDIYMDNIVDIYDISAVLSYYGTKDIQVGDKYIAQDLNRDGKINSMDLALVQVSYGN